MSSVLEILFAWKSLFICSTCATSGETRSEHGKAPSGHDGAKILGGHARARLQAPPTTSLKASETWLKAAAARSDMNRSSSSGSMPDAVSTTCSPPRTSGGRWCEGESKGRRAQQRAALVRTRLSRGSSWGSSPAAWPPASPLLGAGIAAPLPHSKP